MEAAHPNASDNMKLSKHLFRAYSLSVKARVNMCVTRCRRLFFSPTESEQCLHRNSVFTVGAALGLRKNDTTLQKYIEHFDGCMTSECRGLTTVV